MQSDLGLGPLFSPKSIAVIGASNREGSVGRAAFTNILLNQYTWNRLSRQSQRALDKWCPCIPLGPRSARAGGSSGCYRSSLDSPDSRRRIRKKGAKGLVIISVGFKEVGTDGAELERQVCAIAQKFSTRMIGCFRSYRR